VSNFTLDLQKFAAKVPKATKTVVDKICIDLLRKVVLRTPVGNPLLWKGKAPAGYVGGRLRASWNTSPGSPDTQAREPDKTGNGAINRGRAAVAARPVESDVFITNSLPYVQRVEYEGWSTQAPVGMLRVTVTEFQDFVKTAVASESRK